jgi:hypothetical protein
MAGHAMIRSVLGTMVLVVGMTACDYGAKALPTAAPEPTASSAPSAKLVVAPPSAAPTARVPESEWAWLDGPPGEKVRLASLFGNDNLSIRLPEHWQSTVWQGSYEREVGVFFIGSDVGQDHATIRVYLCDRASTKEDLDGDIQTWLSIGHPREAGIVWGPRAPVALGANHIEVRAAKGQLPNDRSTYWQIVFPLADGRSKWIVAVIDEKATPAAREALQASLRSAVRKS